MFEVVSVVIIIIIGDITEGTAVAVPHVETTWVVEYQPVHPVKYLLQNRNRCTVLEIEASDGAKTHNVLFPFCVACRKDCNGACHIGLHQVAVCFVYLGMLPRL